MPHTFAHPLFAAPLKKIIPSLSLTGLILGSMSPDMEYFVAMQPFRTIGHSLIGFFLMVLPACFAFALAFHKIIKPALPELLPDIGSIRQYAAYLNRPWHLSTLIEMIRFLLSIFIGFSTHVLLDSFTHSSGWFVQRIPVLQKEVMGDYVYHILQHFLSLSGLAAAAIYGLYHFWIWKRNHKIEKRSKSLSSPRKLWALLFFAAFVMFFGKLVLSGSFFSISIWAVAPITSGLFGLYLAAMLYSATKLHKARVGLFFIIVIALVVGCYKLWSYYMAFSTPVWVIYNGILTITIGASSIICQRNESRYKFNPMNN
jgi:hypothetical protein